VSVAEAWAVLLLREDEITTAQLIENRRKGVLMADPAAGLHKVVALAAGSGDPEALHAADALCLWIEGNDSVRLEDALGVASNWRSTLRRRQRDALYVGIAQIHFPHLTGLPLARAIKTEIDRYAAGAWLRDRETGRRPDGSNALLYDILNLNERLLDVEGLRKLPGIFRAGESQNQDLGSDEQQGDSHEHVGQDESVFEG
jgi:hypothetical protein